MSVKTVTRIYGWLIIMHVCWIILIKHKEWKDKWPCQEWRLLFWLLSFSAVDKLYLYLETAPGDASQAAIIYSPDQNKSSWTIPVRCIFIIMKSKRFIFSVRDAWDEASTGQKANMNIINKIVTQFHLQQRPLYWSLIII